MGHSSFSRQLHNVSWLHGVDVILLLCPSYVFFGYILHTAVTNLHCFCWKFYVDYGTLENVCWSIEEIFLQHLWYCFVECWVKPNNISRSIFLFLSLIIGVVKINFERTSLQTSEHRLIHILLCWISPHLSSSFSTVSLGWNLEFALWRLVGGLINYECKEAYKKKSMKNFSRQFSECLESSFL